MPASERAVWFGPQQRPLFGWLGGPADGQARGAVLLCPPIGADYRAAHRAYRTLAERLVAAGFVTLRFDYDGTGDSAGGWDDPDRVEAWASSIDAAAAFVRECGAGYVAAVGMQLGAALIEHALTTRSLALDARVYWDPAVRGRTFLRQQQMLLATFEQDAATRDDGGVETAGYLFGADLVADVRRLDISRGLHPGAGRVLVLIRPERPAPAGFVDSLAQRPDVEVDEALGQDTLLDVWPDLAVLPADTIGKIAGWLDDGAPREFTPLTGCGRDAGSVTGADGPGNVRERAVRLGPTGLFGIVTEPDKAGAGDSHEPWMVFLNCSTETRIGPARQWVELARRWATTAGIRSVRVDLSGLGDSPVRTGQTEYLVYAPEALDDIREIAEGISPDDPGNVVFVGLCSGAYLALEGALSLAPKGICVVNPILHHDTARRPRVADPRRRAFRPMAPWLYRLAVKHNRTAQALWNGYTQVAVQRTPMAVLADGVGVGCDVLAVFAEPDAKPFEQNVYWRHLGERWLRRSGRFTMRVLADIDHQLYLHRGRTAIAEELTEHVLSRYAADPHRPAERGATAPGYSVIIPSQGKRPELLRQCVESVVGQSRAPDEVIVVLDGADPNTRRLLGDLPVRFIERTGPDVATARNDGVRAADHEWVCFIDDDDLWHPDFLARAQEYCAEHPDARAIHAPQWTFSVRPDPAAEIVAADLAQCLSAAESQRPTIDMSYTQITGRSYDLLLERNRGRISASMVQREVLLRAGGFPGGYSCAEDWIMFLNVARYTEWHVLDERLGFYRLHETNNTSTAALVNGLIALRAIARVWQDFSRPTPAHRPLPDYAPDYRFMLQDSIWTAVRRGRLDIAAQSYRVARPLLPRGRDRAYALLPPQITWRWEHSLAWLHRLSWLDR